MVITGSNSDVFNQPDLYFGKDKIPYVNQIINLRLMMNRIYLIGIIRPGIFLIKYYLD